MSNKEQDVFINNKTYPNANNIFSLSLSPIEEIKNECKIILDTNVLLVPYLTGSESLKEIKYVFEKLKSKNRLIIPGQVAREFANNRPEKLKNVFQQLSKKLSSLQNINIGKYPLLENLPEYNQVVESEKEINEKIKAYRKKILQLIDKVKSWNWDDPVSLMYRELFTNEVIRDLKIDEENIKKNLAIRYHHRIPPGYKDGGKPDDGIGDYLIWLTILEVAKDKVDVIFVSGDEKTDWYHRSENTSLYPRFELANEYQEASEGKTFHMIKLSQLLSLFEVDDDVVSEVANEELISNISSNQDDTDSQFSFGYDQMLVNDWLYSLNFRSVESKSKNPYKYELKHLNGDIYAYDLNFVKNDLNEVFSNFLNSVEAAKNLGYTRIIILNILKGNEYDSSTVFHVSSMIDKYIKRNSINNQGFTIIHEIGTIDYNEGIFVPI